MSIITIEEWRRRNTRRSDQLPAAPLAPIIAKDARIIFETHGASDDTNRGFDPNAKFPGIAKLAELVGIDQRRLHEIAKGNVRNVSISVADRYMCKTGRHLRDLWPSYYHEELA